MTYINNTAKWGNGYEPILRQLFLYTIEIKLALIIQMTLFEIKMSIVTIGQKQKQFEIQ